MTPGLLKVEQPCPQCGAPVLLEESDRLFACRHCRVRLYLSGGAAPRYFLPPARGEDFLFVPYWHFRGASFAVTHGDITTRFFDKTLRAAGPDGLPLTMGVRTQAMTLRRAARGMEGRFLKPRATGDEALHRAEALSRSFGGLKEKIVHTTFVGEARSLVYAPCYERDGAIWDAVLGRRQVVRDLGDSLGPFEDTSSWRTKFMPALCPECGWDLPGERRSVVLVCTGCRRAWESRNGRWLQISHMILPGTGGTFFPCWELNVHVEGLVPKNYATLPAATRGAWERDGVLLRVPAFASRPRVFMRLAGQLTTGPPGEGEAGDLAGGELRPVTLERDDAMAMAGVVLTMLAVPKRDIYVLLPKLKIRLREAKLVFLPFRERGGDFVQAERGVSFRRNALRS